MLNPRDVTVAYGARQEGQPFRIRLKHRPTGIEVEATGDRYDQVRAEAQELLEKALQEVTH